MLCNYIYLQEEMQINSDAGVYTSYGIRAVNRNNNESTFISDVSLDRNFVSYLCKIFTDNRLDPIHLQEAVLNYI